MVLPTGCRQADSPEAAAPKAQEQRSRERPDSSDSTDPDALRALANQAAQNRNLPLAIESFEHLVNIRPDDADAWQRLGLLYIGDRQSARSVEALSKSAALNPNDPLTLRSLGIMSLRLGRLDDAYRALRTAITRQPNDAEARSALASVMMRLDPSPAGLAAAEQQVDTALNIRPSGDGYNTRGQIRMAQRRFADAIQDLTYAIKLQPRTKSTYLLLSQCYASAGKPDLARKISSEYERLAAVQAVRNGLHAATKDARR